MSRKIARITQEKKLLLADEIIEDNRYSLSEHGKLYTKNILEGNKFSIDEEFIEVDESIEGYPFVKPVIDDSLVLWLDGSTGNNYDKTGTWKDLSGNGNDGQLVNFGYTENSGWVDGGLKFDGVDDYVDCGQIPELNKEETITVEVFMKFNYLDYKTGTGNIITIACKGMTDTISPHSGFMFTYDNRNNNSIFNYTCFGNSEGGFAGGSNNFRNVSYKFETDKLYHLAFTINNSIGKFFINGIQIGDSKQFKNLRLLTEKPLQFSRWGSYREPMEIFSFRIYNRALTDEEIMQNYQAGQCSPLLAMRGDIDG